MGGVLVASHFLFSGFKWARGFKSFDVMRNCDLEGYLW